MGFERTGQAATKYLHAQGAIVTVTDTRTRADFFDAIKEFQNLEIEFEFGKPNEETFLAAELIVLSPGVPRSNPEIQAAIKAGIPITNDLELAYPAMKDSKATIIAVTGTNGKTTTTTMISDMLKCSGKNVFTGGNIGISALEMLNQNLKPEVIVLEISSFQCETLQDFKPNILVLTHLEPDHLDRYSNAEAYYSAKKRLLKGLDAKASLVLNLDNAASLAWAKETKAQTYWFTKRDPLKIELNEPTLFPKNVAESFRGTYLKRPKIVSKMGEEIIFDLMMAKVPGDHNRENFMAAVCASRLAGGTPQGIQKAIVEFKGVSHRLEYVRRKDGVSFYNDSKATNVGSVVRSLSSFNAKIILIAGGRDKDQDFNPLVDLVASKVKNLILVGESKEKLNRALGDYSETFLVGTFEEAVLIAFQKSRTGDIVLFSPACASQDMFRNFEERGDYFKKLVVSL